MFICESADGVCTLRATVKEANAQPGLRVIALGNSQDRHRISWVDLTIYTAIVPRNDDFLSGGMNKNPRLNLPEILQHIVQI